MESNSVSRVKKALELKVPNRVPFFPMFRDLVIRISEFNFSECMHDPFRFVEAELNGMKKMGSDVAQDFSAIHVESEAIGSELDIPEKDSPSVVNPAVKDYSDLKQLSVPDPRKDGRMPKMLDIVNELKKKIGGRYPIVAYVQCPFRNAAMLRGTDRLMMDLYDYPEKLNELLKFTTEVGIRYGESLVNAGADYLFLSDPISSGNLLSAEHYKNTVFPHTKRMVESFKEQGIKTFMHVCGDTSDRLEIMSSSGVDCLSLDHQVDLDYAKEIVGDEVCLMGNVDPSRILSESIEEIEKLSKKCCSLAAENGGFILSSGCGIPAGSPVENVRTMFKVAKSWTY